MRAPLGKQHTRTGTGRGHERNWQQLVSRRGSAAQAAEQVQQAGCLADEAQQAVGAHQRQQAAGVLAQGQQAGDDVHQGQQGVLVLKQAVQVALQGAGRAGRTGEGSRNRAARRRAARVGDAPPWQAPWGASQLQGHGSARGMRSSLLGCPHADVRTKSRLTFRLSRPLFWELTWSFRVLTMACRGREAHGPQ